MTAVVAAVTATATATTAYVYGPKACLSNSLNISSTQKSIKKNNSVNKLQTDEFMNIFSQ